MPTAAPFTPLKKKPNILWWLGGGFVLLVFLFFLQLFGPNPAIIVSPQTTFITEPLGTDGLPDYEQSVRESSRDGVTPENNAAVLLWQALWPGELDQKDYAAVVTELGLAQIPSADDALDKLYSRANQAAIADWLNEQDAPAAKTDFAAVALDFEMARETTDPREHEQTENVIRQAMARPWTSAEIPPLAKWVASNKQPLDLLLEASRRSRCYFPSPSLLNRERESLIEMLLPGAQSVREAGRSLSARAMWHVGEGRLDPAWQDLLATHRIGRLTAQGPTLVEQLVGMAIANIATDGTLALLDDRRLTVEQARQVQRDLAGLPNFASIDDALDSMERLSYLDACIQVGVRRNGKTFHEGSFEATSGIFNAVSVDWNVVLQKGNEFYDRLVAAARIQDRKARNRALSLVHVDLEQLAIETRRPASFVAGAFSPTRRSEIMAAQMLGLFLPAVGAAINADDRANTMLALTRLAAALAMHRAEHGDYPEKLSQLVPGEADQLPVDLYNAKPFHYKRTDDGYLLYSAGENGADDGGSSEMYGVSKGRPAEDLDSVEAEKRQAQIPAGADDISIRLPKPKWEMPKPPEANEEP